MDLKKSNKNVSIEEFIQFFSEKVKKEENVHFIKGSSRPEGERGQLNKKSSKNVSREIQREKSGK